MNILTVTTPFNIDLEFRLASFYKRILATLLDIIAICFYTYIALFWILAPLNVLFSVKHTIWLIVIAVPSFLYPLICETLMNGQTFGKKIVGLKLMDIEGNEPTFSQYLLRFLLSIGNYFVYIIPYLILNSVFLLFIFYLLFFLFIIYIPDAICIAVSKKSQRLGDLAAGTVLIDYKARTSIQETIYLDIEEENYQPKYPEVMRLSDRDINGIKNLLSMKTNSKDVQNYMIDVSHRIKVVLGIQSDLYAKDFLEQLLRDYNALTRK